MSLKQNDDYNEAKMDYFKDNPRVLCPNCKENTFRRKAFNRNGEERVYTCNREMCRLVNIKRILWNGKIILKDRLRTQTVSLRKIGVK